MKRRALPEIPKPHSPRPWTQPRDTGPVFDAKGNVVSFVENAPFLVHVEQLHEPLIIALDVARKQLLADRRRLVADVRRAADIHWDDITETLKVVNAVLKKARGKL